jgi:DUF1009 family protein
VSVGPSAPPGRIGLIAGGGILPRLFAEEAKRRGLEVVAVCHRGETDPSLVDAVGAASWVRVGQLNGIVRALKAGGVDRAVMAGGIGRVKALTQARPDLGALKVAARLRSFRDDALLRGVARYIEDAGIRIVAPTDFLTRLLAPHGHIAGPPATSAQLADVAVGLEVATLLGQADVGQTVVVRERLVLALEAVDGTDETIRRGGRLGGPGAAVVKLSKPGQDRRFDLPAIGTGTIAVMEEAGARLLAVEAGRSLLLDVEALAAAADRAGICVEGVSRGQKVG